MSELAQAPASTPREEIEQFLYTEAELLDSWQLDAWLALFTDDCAYWVPSNTDDQDPDSRPSLIYDNRIQLEDRVKRMRSPLVFTQTPRARTRRMISNVRLGATDGPEVQVFSNFLLYEVRLERQRLLGGQCEHLLRREPGGWRIRKKRVALLTNDQAMGSVTLLL
jgi:3-phenylpropionate/cinnamic acid dioxygenase small subunit